MLEHNFWKEWEPRVSFPTFRGVENTFSFVPDLSLTKRTPRTLALPFYYLWQGQKSFKSTLQTFNWIVTQKKIQFRGALLNRDGALLSQFSVPGEFGPGDIFEVNVSELRRKAGLPDEDGQFLLIASRGRLDRMNSAPGNTTIRYIGDNFIAGYRTGFFARPLNSSTKGHFGFTGINPQIMATDKLVSSLLLINHSSNPAYTTSVTPTVRLYRNNEEFIENSFGTITPLGMREMSILDLFPNAKEFLAPNKGLGTTITKAKGVTLASLHITRCSNGGSFGIEHSRPSHANVVNYTRVKNYMGKTKKSS